MHKIDRLINFFKHIGNEYFGNIFKIIEFCIVLLYYLTFMFFFHTGYGS